MLIPNNGDSTVSVIDTTSQKIVAQLNAGTEMTGINYALDGSKAYVISRGESTVHVFDMDCRKTIVRAAETDGPYRKYVLPEVGPWQMRLVVTAPD